mgnify:CR=1 FL=1
MSSANSNIPVISRDLLMLYGDLLYGFEALQLNSGKIYAYNDIYFNVYDLDDDIHFLKSITRIDSLRKYSHSARRDIFRNFNIL